MATIRLDNGRAIVTGRQVADQQFDAALWFSERPDWVYIQRIIDDGNMIVWHRVCPQDGESIDDAFALLDRLIDKAMTDDPEPIVSAPAAQWKPIREYMADKTPEQRKAAAKKAREMREAHRTIAARRWPPARITALRTFLGDTYREFAARLDLHHSTIRLWESGTRGGNLTIKNAEALDALYERHKLDILASYPDPILLAPGEK